MNVESKQVVAQSSPEKIYNFLTDFNNIGRMLPPGQVQGWQCTSDRCSFNVGGFMQITLAFLERTPYSRIVLGPAADSSAPMPFKMMLSLQPEGTDATRIKVMFDLEGGNPMMNMMLKPKLRDAADKMAEQLQYFGSAL